MKRYIGLFCVLAMLLALLSAVPMAASAESDIALNDKNLRWIGRTAESGGGIAVGWGMTELTFNIKGSSAKVKISTGQEAPQAPYFAVYINNRLDKKIKIEKGSNWYELANGLDPNATTNIRLVKTNEVWMTAIVEKLTINGSLTELPKRREKLIEVVGDSISAAYGILTSDNDAPDDEFTDATFGYAIALADKMGAELNLIANSGRGVYCNNDGSTGSTMPKVYPKRLTSVNNAKWDHSISNPDLIVVNLGTNDEYGNAPKDKFEEAVASFLTYLTDTHPTTQIVWTYGLMNSAMTDSIKSAVDKFGHKNVHFIPLPNQSQFSSAPTSKAAHPNTETNKKAADYLYEKMNELGIIAAVNNRDRSEVASGNNKNPMVEYQVDNRPKPTGVAPEEDGKIETPTTDSSSKPSDSQNSSATSKPSNTPSEEKTDKEVSSDKAEGQSGIILYIIIGIVELVLIAGVVVLIIRKAKR